MLYIFYTRPDSPGAMARTVVSHSRAEAEAIRARLTGNGEIAGEIVEVAPNDQGAASWDSQRRIPAEA
jgi:hypothetical protein